ncbi:class I SAM-dependent methyltransferase [Synechocystis sp. FACHB-383]|uniref:class I SAM-dependent methyltransferase n=1 Tax=Synechocystis sp. FACHB-383 TaxID=2692864 RepID=UPI001683601E|nr:class I SAM-dependent methyltransferase [Synechocystis sp. FACHB-383]MBD2654451.1 class I SAM-dependent methyltransferase [Synechocystis sp. FACHB-383]
MHSSVDLSCLACGEADNFHPFTVRETMLGIGDIHQYGECQNCGSIQNLALPKDLSRYYPNHYYSLTPSKENQLKTWLRTQRAHHGLGKTTPIGALSTLFFGQPYFVPWLKYSRITYDSAILDIGCGGGTLLRHLHACGYQNLTGVDPFLKESVKVAGIELLKLGIEGLDQNQNYDLIMLHHSLEHMVEPLWTLKHIARLLNPQGIALIRIPVAGTWAWRTYGANWVQLDAPRHLLIPSVQGMKQLIEQAGLCLQKIEFDSDQFQFIGSEKNRLGKAFNTDPKDLFSSRQLQQFTQQAHQLNTENDGDQACFWIKRG